MNPKKETKGTPFQRIPEACMSTGLSQFFLRNGCKDGTVPHIKSGTTYYINVPALLKQLGADGDPNSSACAGSQ